MIIERDSPSWQVTLLSLLVLPRCYCDCSGFFQPSKQSKASVWCFDCELDARIHEDPKNTHVDTATPGIAESIHIRIKVRRGKCFVSFIVEVADHIVKLRS